MRKIGTAIDLTGQRYGRLVCLEKVKPVGVTTMTSAWWRCQCDCGAIVDVPTQSMRRGDTKSCGCYKKEMLHKSYLAYIERRKQREGSQADVDAGGV